MITSISLDRLEELNQISKYFNIKYSFDEFNDIKKILLYIIDNKIVGYIDYSIYYERVEINYIFVLEEYRHNKIATKLLNHLFNLLKDKENITLEVRETNEIAKKLYVKNGFRICSIRKNYYNNEDGLLLIKELGDNNE